MPTAPFPRTLPGDFYLLVYERDLDTFTIHLDDSDKTSFALGSDVTKVMQRFKYWGIPKLGNETVDLAREFGMAQGIFSLQRSIPIFERPSEKAQSVKWEDGEDGQKKFEALPSLP